MSIRSILGIERTAVEEPQPEAPRKGGRPISGKGAVISFTRLEVYVLKNYAVGYPLEEASESERQAFTSALAKIDAADRQS